MKISVSISDDDIRFVDSLASEGAYPSRSAAVQAAIRLLRDRRDVDSYAAAWDEWEGTDDAVLWESVASDGVK